MKPLLILALFLVSVFGFSQEQHKPLDQLPLVITTGYKGSFETVYNSLDNLSKHITKNSVILKRENEIRQGQLIISTENMGKALKNVKIDMRPSLDIEVQRIMFTGNFINPNNPTGCIRMD